MEERAIPSRTLPVLALLMAFSSVATDLYLPAIPSIANDFGASAGSVEASVASYLAGFVIGQLLWGPVGDAQGRKAPILLGLVLFLAASVGCAMAQDATALASWRLLQGLGGSAAVVLARAMVRDLYAGDDAARMLSTLIAIMALAPLIGPLIGAQILRFAGWEAIFWSLCAVAGFALFAVASLPETRPKPTESAAPISGHFSAYLGATRNRALMGFAVVGACFYGGMFAFISASPEVFIDGFGFSPTLFALLLAAGTALVIGANIANMRLISALGYVRALQLGAGIACVAGIAALAAAFFVPAYSAPLIVAIMAYMTMAGLVVANSLTGAMDALDDRPGTASALAGALHFGGGAVGSAVAAALADGTALPMAATMAVCGAGTVVFSSKVPPAIGQRGNVP